MSSALRRVIAAAVRSNTNILLYGHPGVGKTASISAMARQWGYHTEVVVGSNREPQDFLGLPYENDGMTAYLDVDWARRAADANKAIVFFDEFSTGGETFKAMLRVLGERVVGNLEMPDTVSFIAACNPVDIAVDGTDLPGPIANRFVHLDWHFDAEEWLTNVTSDFQAIAYDSLSTHITDADRTATKAMFSAYLNARRDRINPGQPDDPTQASRAWPSPRSWTYAMNLVAELDPGDNEAWLLALTGAVGERDATAFLAWKAQADLYDPLWALDHIDKIDFTGRPDRVFALLSAVGALGMNDTKKWLPAMKLVQACADANRPDLALPTLTKLLNAKPKGKDVPEGIIESYSDLFEATGHWAA